MIAAVVRYFSETAPALKTGDEVSLLVFLVVFFGILFIGWLAVEDE